MSTLYDFAYWITTLQLYGNRLNILGLFWLVSMIVYTYKQLKDPLNAFRAEHGRKQINWFVMLAAAVIPVILLHFITDEIMTFMVIFTGGWRIYAGTPAFSWLLLWNMKFDVYLSIICFVMMGIMLDLEKFFKIRKSSLLLFGINLSVFFYAAFIRVGDFTLFQGWDRFWRFWIFYPTTYILLTLLYISMIKKTPKHKDPQFPAPDKATDYGVLGRMVSVGRHSLMKRLARPNCFGLNAGSGQTWFYNKINLDVLRSRNTDVQADLRAIPFRNGVFQEIIIDEVLEHIPQDRKVLAELRRVIAPDGWLYVSVPVTGLLAKIDKILLHQKEYHSSYSIKKLSQMLSDAGFIVKHSLIYGTLPHYLRIQTLGGCLFMIAQPRRSS